MMNRYKYLELVDRGHGELQMKVRNIVQEAVTKTILKKKKCKKTKWLSVQKHEVLKMVESGLPWWSSGFPYCLQLKSEFGNKEFMI